MKRTVIFMAALVLPLLSTTLQASAAAQPDVATAEQVSAAAQPDDAMSGQVSERSGRDGRAGCQDNEGTEAEGEIRTVDGEGGPAQQYILHPWAGKRVAYLGDSITDPNNNGSKVKYWGFLEQWLGITPYVFGISGRQWNDIPRQAERLKEEHGDEVDAIIVFIGTNDYNAGVPIGKWYDERPGKVVAGIHEPKHPVDRLHRTPSEDTDTYRGRINVAMKRLKELYPTKQIVLLTPLHRAGFYANDSNWQPTEDYTNQCGEYIDAYIDSVKEAGNIWAVPVIDWNASSGLYPLLDPQAVYFKDAENDRLHPNDAGHIRLARTLMYQLLTLPCTFE